MPRPAAPQDRPAVHAAPIAPVDGTGPAGAPRRAPAHRSNRPHRSSRSSPRRAGALAAARAGVVMVAAAVTGVLALQGAAVPTPAPVAGAADDRPRAASASGPSLASGSSGVEADAGGGAAGRDDGVLPDGATPFDDDLPGIARLDDDLLDALRAAARSAEDDGVGILVNSGWRSPAYQDELLREAVAEHGSTEEAARWVATASTSPHVSGEAVDVGPAAATAWLAEHGAAYGLCQIYRNEPWHYELRAGAADHGCPAMYADPTEDPRMR